jgi:hypothetical protein
LVTTGAALLVVAGAEGLALALVAAADGVVDADADADADALAAAWAATWTAAECATGAVAAWASGAVAASAPMTAPVTAVHEAAVTASLCLCAARDAGMDRRSLDTNYLPSAAGTTKRRPFPVGGSCASFARYTALRPI